MVPAYVAPAALTTVEAPGLVLSETVHDAPLFVETRMPLPVARYTVEPDCANWVASERSTLVHVLPLLTERNVPPNSVAASTIDGLPWSSHKPLTTDEIVPSVFVSPLFAVIQWLPPSVVR